ncbi:MAG TPA: KorB domain-containing protein, partial [Anaerolineales bacterium]
AILMDGFKRYRCARKLRLPTVPFASWGSDEVGGITQLLRGSPHQGLHLLEQARFVDELKSQHGMGIAEIARQLSRSKAWVSLRLGLITQLSPRARDALFTGAFPVYSYLYSLRRFRRVNSQADIDQFIGALRGKKLSVREIEGLAHGFFRGPESFRQEILQGNLALALEQIQQAPPDPDSCSEFERVFLHDLELTQKAIGRVIPKSLDPRLHSPAFMVECNLLSAVLLNQTTAFVKTLRHLHDRTAKT